MSTREAVEAHLLGALSEAGIKGAELIAALHKTTAYSMLSLGETSGADDIAQAAAQAARIHVASRPPAPAPAPAAPAAKVDHNAPVTMADLIARHGPSVERLSVTQRLTFARALAEERAGPNAKTSFASLKAKPVAKVSLAEMEAAFGADAVARMTPVQKLRNLGLLQDQREREARSAA